MLYIQHMIRHEDNPQKIMNNKGKETLQKKFNVKQVPGR